MSSAANSDTRLNPATLEATPDLEPMVGIEGTSPSHPNNIRTPAAPAENSPPESPAAFRTGLINTRFRIRIPGLGGRQGTYANTLKQTTEQAEEGPSQNLPGQPNHPAMTGVEQLELQPPPGPIKGFSSKRVLENLDPQVHEVWQKRTADAASDLESDTGDKGSNTWWVHAENIVITVNK
ncbi:hypothetical protein BJ322DRAFT_1110452 [Thelephora terrestris]|uniref:Uncharacterized protein n=1 Tax=Thelephora terrestris TaxID=56493 RepID=A0A9P6L518_9AGAM|nr:hypothetical protein BJ322DRAFT_1110452 [Thelephora terrestris]